IKGHYRASDSHTAQLERRKIATAVHNMAERAHAVQSHADKIQGMLTPDQTVRFHKWALAHRANHTATLNARRIAPAPHLSPDMSSILQTTDVTAHDLTAMLAAMTNPENGAART
ncbi:hypothetical protein DYB25_006361, partial [Aphanomyces astaci]